jgi:hypothetical protein
LEILEYFECLLELSSPKLQNFNFHRYKPILAEYICRHLQLRRYRNGEPLNKRKKNKDFIFI